MQMRLNEHQTDSNINFLRNLFPPGKAQRVLSRLILQQAQVFGLRYYSEISSQFSCSCLPSYSLLFVARGLKGQLGGNYVCPPENIAQPRSHTVYWKQGTGGLILFAK